MAHFAEIDENNVVLRVIVVGNDDITVDGVEDESVGAQFCHDLFGGIWVQTHYSGARRRNFAGPGFVWHPDLHGGAFVPPQPWPSWILNHDIMNWEPPVERVAGCDWDEESLSWVRHESPFPSWVWNDTDARWKSPKPYPDDNRFYVWNEATGNWDLG